jgi:hypothetical protein
MGMMMELLGAPSKEFLTVFKKKKIFFLLIFSENNSNFLIYFFNLYFILELYKEKIFF